MPRRHLVLMMMREREREREREMFIEDLIVIKNTITGFDVNQLNQGKTICAH